MDQKGNANPAKLLPPPMQLRSCDRICDINFIQLSNQFLADNSLMHTYVIGDTAQTVLCFSVRIFNNSFLTASVMAVPRVRP